ncbi:MAG: hypothetical protein JWM68_686 [Verrucomicrobiales bacterium]|nr:hypothetical protein [Verrucomicrobiales bacterium]
MNQGQEEFNKLRKLLALKRHEQPPPGYFDRLPNQILSRIKAGEVTESFWQRLLPKIVLRPAFAYGFGMAACVLLAFGASYVLQNEPSPNGGGSLMTAQPVESPAMASAPTFLMASNSASTTASSSTNPVNPQPLFEPNIQVLPANFPGQNK